jgi:hypothetical protein
VLTPDCEYNSNPPVEASYQLKVPDPAPAAADKVAVGLPQVFAFVTVIDGMLETVATTAALAVVQVPLSNDT